jgi:2'-5' RNA ligase
MRCIFLVPESEKIDELQELRLRLDPLALKVPPHITVVFPFDLPMPQADLAALLTAAGPMLPIAFSLGAPMVMGDSLVFPTTLGSGEIVALHGLLHSGLPSQLRPNGPFLPHLTFGRTTQGRIHLDQGRKLLPFHGVARRLVLERIGDDDESIAEFETAGD